MNPHLAASVPQHLQLRLHFMEREGNIKYKREIMHKPAEASTVSASCELRKCMAGESAGSFS